MRRFVIGLLLFSLSTTELAINQINHNGSDAVLFLDNGTLILACILIAHGARALLNRAVAAGLVASKVLDKESK